MVDFSKKGIKSMRERLKERAATENSVMKSNREMAKRLLEMVENDKIDNDFDVGFIRSVHAQLAMGRSLSEKQQAHLDKCFHDKY